MTKEPLLEQVIPVFCRTACLSAVLISILGFFNFSHDQIELPKLAALALYAGLGLVVGCAGTIGSIPRYLRFLPILALAMAASIPFSASPEASFLGDYENFAGLMTWVIYGMLLVLADAFFRGSKTNRLAFMIVMTATVSAAYGLAQSLEMDFRTWDQSTVIKARTFGAMGNPNFQAGLLAIAVPLGLAYSLRPRVLRTGRNNIIFRMCIGAGSAICLGAMFQTNSRGGFLGLTLGLGLFFFLLLGKRPGWTLRKSAAVVMVGLTLTVIFGRPLLGRLRATLENPRENLLRSRGHIWGPGLRMVQDNPLLGHGLDTFKIVFPNYQGREFSDIDGEWVSSRTAHSEPLQFAATTGLVGLGAYCLALVCLLRFGNHALGHSTSPRERMALLGLGTALAAYWGQSLVGFGVAGTLTPSALILGAMFAQRPAKNPKSVIDPKSLIDPASQAPSHAKSRATRYLTILGGMLLAVFWLQRLTADVYFAQARILTTNLGSISNKKQASQTLQRGLWGYNRACKIMAWEPKYFVYRGLAYEDGLVFGLADPSQKYFIRAEQNYKKTLSLSGLNAYYHNNLGRLYELGSTRGKTGLIRNARQKYLRAASLGKNVSFFWANVGLFEESQARSEDADRALKKAGDLNPNLGADAYLRAAQFNLRQNRIVRARNLAGLGLELQRGHPELLRMLEKIQP